MGTVQFKRLDNWPEEIMPIIQAFEHRRFPDRGREVGPLIIWSLRTHESLNYIEELARIDRSQSKLLSSHRSEIKDIAHVRWATGAAITSLDLCAAAIGREYRQKTGNRDLDLRDIILPIDPNNGRFKKIERTRSKLPQDVLEWVDNVGNDQRYQTVLSYRNPLTHSRVFLDRFIGPGAPRTEFRVKPKTKLEAPDTLTVAGVINLTKKLVQPHLDGFIDLLLKL